MNKSDDISLLAAALVKAQPMVEGAKKDSVNPHFRSKYADLGSVWDAVSEALEKNDLAVSQWPDETTQGMPALTTMLIHKSGQWISATYPLISAKQDPQGFVSAQTYARRTGLAAIMGVVAEDDDGEGASRVPKPAAKAPEPDKPKAMTWGEWIAKAEGEVAACSTAAALTDWLQTNSDRIEALNAKDKAAYTALNIKIKARKQELGE